MQNKDTILQALLMGGAVRVTAISGKAMIEEARRIHSLSRVCTAALGRQLMATAMMAAQLKHEGESLTTILRGTGPAGNLVCTGRFQARVKGYAANPEVELPLKPSGKLDVSGAVGSGGKLTVVRDLSLREPYVGEVSLVSGEVAEDFAQYFAVSEQQPSLVYLGVRLRPGDGDVLAAGGLFAQPLPGCPEEDILLLQEKAADIERLSLKLEEGLTLEAALKELFSDMELELTGSLSPAWECDCSVERTERALIALGREELTDMIEQDGGAELTCQFCRRAYSFDAQALSTLLMEAGGA
ncbi:MAG TPA: Hsp33 family molecular chaperone HslO [Feifaniaceae bacterium]|nr:Hsp33 family molecular chaperone HslO [Feifaniaceae bacterium]